MTRILFASKKHIRPWRDEFDTWTDSGYPDYLHNGRWGSNLYRNGNAITLPANGDKQVWLSDGFNSGNGPIGPALAANGSWGPGPFLHDVSNGTIKLRAYPLTQAEGDTYAYGYRFVSGSIFDSTPPMFTSGGIGTWTVRFRINSFGQGQHIAIWLQSDTGVWPPEIDILEVINGQDTWHAGVHFGQPMPIMTDYTRHGGPSDWYILKLILTADTITWILNDDSIVRQHENPFGFTYRYYFGISWEIGTNWTGLTDATSPWPAEIEVDYVDFEGV